MSYTPLVNTIFTGDTRAVTATAGDSDTTVATTAFVQGELGDYLSLSGGTMTGDITLGSGVDINFDDTSSGLQWSDVRVERTAANVISLDAGDYLRVQQDPVDDDDLTRKSYVDSVAQGLDVKESVRVVTTIALPAYTRTGNDITADANGALPTIDGVTLVLGDRLLLKDGAAGADNGIYEVTAVGDGSNPFELSRTSDADNSPAGEVTSGMFTFVEEGTAHADSGWVLATNDPITLNTTALTFTQFSSAVVVAELNDLTDVDTTGVVDGALLRYEDSGAEWNDTSTLLFNDDGQLQVTTAGANAGVLIGGDVQLYRSGADELTIQADAGITTSSSIYVLQDGIDIAQGDFYLGSDGAMSPVIYHYAADPNDPAYEVSDQFGGDTNPRFRWNVSGVMEWGPGNAATDTQLYRDGVSHLTAAATILEVTGGATATLLLGGQNIVVDGTTLELQDTEQLDIQLNNGKETITLATGTDVGLTIGTDTNLYRSAANTLKTDDAFDVVGRLIAEAGQRVAVSTVKTGAYTVDLATDYVVRTDSSGGAFTVTLPASHTSGDMVIIKDVAGSASTNNVTIDPSDADTIDGTASVALTVNYQALTLVSNGTNWFIV